MRKFAKLLFLWLLEFIVICLFVLELIIWMALWIITWGTFPFNTRKMLTVQLYYWIHKVLQTREHYAREYYSKNWGR